MLRPRTAWYFLLMCTALACSVAPGQDNAREKRRAVLILTIDQPNRPFARDLIDGIQDSTREAIGLSTFIEFQGSTALESSDVAVQRQKLLAARYAGKDIDIIVAIGDRTIPEAERLRNELFPAAKLLFLVSSKDTIRSGVRQGEGLWVDSGPLSSVRLALALMPERRHLVVISGTTAVDQMWRESVADSLHEFPGKIDATYLNGVPLPELVKSARNFPRNSIVVLTTNMVDRSGRATGNVDQARELSSVTEAPVVEGTDLSLGQGSLGGEVAGFRLTGQEIGRRIQRTLDTGEAPDGVTIDTAPRRKVLDWRQLKRLGISEDRVPPGFEILYREPTLWREHRIAIVTILGSLIIQTVLISFLLAERRRRAEAQTRLQRQLKLEAMVAKASAHFSAATPDEIPPQLHQISAGLFESIGIERVVVWVQTPEEHEYFPVHWWPETKLPAQRDAVHQRFPFLHRKMLGGLTVSAASLTELPSDATLDVAELQALGYVSLLMIPLKGADEPIGALILGTYHHVTNWETETISTLQVLASSLGQGISRSMSEERVHRSEEQNRAMLASLPGFVLMLDGQGKILRQNNRLDLPEAELPKALAGARLGQNYLDRWRADGEGGTHVAEALDDVIRGDQTSLVMEYRYETEAGTRWLEVHAESISEGQRGAVVSQIDITRRKEQESENAQNRQTAWHLNRVAALGELTASLAHEINQPLAAILSSGEAAFGYLSRPVPDLAEALEAVRDIVEDDKRAGAIIGRMRSMLKRGHEKTQAVDLCATVDDTLRLLINEARLRHVILRHIPTRNLPPIVADPTQLQQVILNLITNGMEAAETMPGHREVEIRTFCTAADGIQFLEVSDSGPGIPSDKLKTIFEPFYTSKREGLGLGLSICRSIIDSFGGKITVESPPNGGAVFRVSVRTFFQVAGKVTSQAI
jgi:two-component system, LuxR family, sensor kinase FixL